MPKRLPFAVKKAVIAILTVMLALGGDAASAQSVGITIDDLKNLSYPTAVLLTDSFPRVTLRNGEWAESFEPGTVPLRYSARFLRGAAEADFAASILAASLGGSGQTVALFLVTKDGGQLVAQPNPVVLGDRVLVNSVSVSRDRIVLDMVVHGSDPSCCPTKPETQEYRREGDRLVAVAVNGQPVPPQTGNIGERRTAASTQLLASLVALALPLGARRLIGAVQEA